MFYSESYRSDYILATFDLESYFSTLDELYRRYFDSTVDTPCVTDIESPRSKRSEDESISMREVCRFFLQKVI